VLGARVVEKAAVVVLCGFVVGVVIVRWEVEGLWGGGGGDDRKLYRQPCAYRVLQIWLQPGHAWSNICTHIL